LEDAAEAEDAAQLSLLEILQSASSFRNTGPLEAWADRITVRTTLRLARQLRAQRGVFERFTEGETVRQLFPKSQVDRAGSLDLEHFLERLPSARREAFVLKYGLGYSVEEIASITQVPTGTVKDRLIMAKRKLREMIHREALVAKKGSLS
jgi:RNA polymerase sigma-70 factor (ECF subfamily)